MIVALRLTAAAIGLALTALALAYPYLIGSIHHG